MINQAIRFAVGALVGFGVATGCGATPEDDQIGQTQEAYTSQRTTGPGHILGVITGGCSPVGSAAVAGMTESCRAVVPNAVTNIIVGIPAASESARLRDATTRAVNGLNANMLGTFMRFSLLASGTNGSHVSVANDPALHGPGGGIRAYNGAFGGVGIQCSTIALFDTPNVGGSFATFATVGLPPGPSECTINVNVTQLNTDFTDATQRQHVMTHAVANALIEMAGLGYGGHSNSFPLAVTDTTISTTADKVGLVPGQLCLLQSYSDDNHSQWHEGAAGCANYPAGI